MYLAHTLGAGGPDLELFLFAAALLILGVVLFLQKSAKPVVSVVLVVAGVHRRNGGVRVGRIIVDHFVERNRRGPRRGEH
jgi:hypothetical protein